MSVSPRCLHQQDELSVASTGDPQQDAADPRRFSRLEVPGADPSGISQLQTPTEDEVVSSEPIKFSTSKASHRSWKVDRSMGSQYQRPWWKVVPISLALAGFLLWCALRKETDVDAQLEKQLYKHLPGLVSDEEAEQDGGK